MASPTTNTLDASRPPRLSDRAASRWFFPAASSLLLVGIFLGFAKTFFLRSEFHLAPMPRYLYVHGIVLTSWFALFVAQTFLVARHRTDVHRRLGVLSVVVAGLLIPISLYVIVHAAQRLGGTITPLLRLEVVGDLLSLIWFAGFVAAGVYFRRRPDIHKRLMVASFFSIYGPVFARFEYVYRLPAPPPAVIPLGLVVLCAYDLVVARRLHRTTGWIAVAWIGGLVPLAAVIASGAADSIIRALR